MNTKKFTIIFLFVVLVIAAMLRLWQLGKTPAGLDWDEVALGYDAYSILHTGRDEFGKFLPVVLRSFDDYKPALYAYLIIPFLPMFGLTAFAVRLPSAVFGTLGVLATYFLLKELFDNSKYFFKIKHHVIGIPEIGTILLALSPWSIHFSRIAFEANVGMALNIFTALFFVKGLKKPWYISLAALFAGLNIYTYQSEKVFVPLFVFALIAIFWKKIWNMQKRYLIAAVTVGTIVVLPMIVFIITNHNALLRVQGTLIFSDQTVFLQSNVQRLIHDRDNHDLIGLFLDNRRFVYAKAIISGYLSHFNLNWLFITGDIARHHAPYMGLLYLYELPFLLIGLFMGLFGPFEKKTKLTIFAWFLLAPVPASVTSGVPHAVRTINFLPTFQIFTAIGLLQSKFFIEKYIATRKFLEIRYGLYAIFLLVVLCNIAYYFNQNFAQLDYFTSGNWQYQYLKLFPGVEKMRKQYKKAVVSDKRPLDKSYMFFLFYLQYPPDLYQKANNLSGSFSSTHSFGSYEFRKLNWETDLRQKHVLYIGSPDEFPGSILPIETIYLLDGTPAVTIFGT